MHSLEIIAWLLVRITLAWLFLYPLIAIFKDWKGMVDGMGLLTPYCHRLMAFLMVIVMIVSALSVLLGFYGQIGGLLMCLYCLVGVLFHYRLANTVIGGTHLSEQANAQDTSAYQTARGVGILGHITSAEKNIPIAAMGFYLFVMGSGPLSLTPNLF